MKLSAERICVSLRNRGLPVADIRSYKSSMALFDAQLSKRIFEAIRNIDLGFDDYESVKFLRELDAVIRGGNVQTHDTMLLDLMDRVQQQAQNTTTQAGQMDAYQPVRARGAPHIETPRYERATPIQRKKHYVYGTKAAFMFELDFLKTKPNQEPLRTVTLEAAHLVAPRNYDWEQRVSFQLTQLELPQFTAAMFGYLQQGQIWEARNHGRMRDKHLRCLEQNSSLYFKIEQAGSRWPLRVEQNHRYQILSLCLEALKLNDPHLDISSIKQLCEASLPKL